MSRSQLTTAVPPVHSALSVGSRSEAVMVATFLSGGRRTVLAIFPAACEDGQDLAAEDGDDGLLEVPLEDHDLVRRTRVQVLAELFRGPGCVAHGLDGLGRIQLEQAGSEFFCLGSEQTDGRGLALDGVLDRPELVQHRLESGRCALAALGDLQAHLPGVQAEALVRGLAAGGHVD
jgi:hypothetical protein